MEYGLRDVDGSGMQSFFQGFYEYFSDLSRISFFREQLSYETLNIMNNKISNDLKSDLFLSNQHCVSPFFPSNFPLGQLAGYNRIPSFALSLPVWGRQRCKRRLDTTTTPPNSFPPSQTHPFSTLPSSSQQQKRQGHEFTLLTGSSFF